MLVSKSWFIRGNSVPTQATRHPRRRRRRRRRRRHRRRRQLNMSMFKHRHLVLSMFVCMHNAPHFGYRIFLQNVVHRDKHNFVDKKNKHNVVCGHRYSTSNLHASPCVCVHPTCTLRNTSDWQPRATEWKYAFTAFPRDISFPVSQPATSDSKYRFWYRCRSEGLCYLGTCTPSTAVNTSAEITCGQ